MYFSKKQKKEATTQTEKIDKGRNYNKGVYEWNIIIRIRKKILNLDFDFDFLVMDWAIDGISNNEEFSGVFLFEEVYLTVRD